MRYFKALYIKELKGERDSLLGLSVLIIIFIVLLLTRIGKWETGAVSSFFFLPMNLIPIWFIFASIDMLSKEWKENTISLLSSLPSDTRYVVGAKICAVWTEYLILFLLVLLGRVLVSVFEYSTAGIVVNSFLTGSGIMSLQIIYLFPLTSILFMIYLTGAAVNRWALLVRAFTAMALGFIIYAGELILRSILGVQYISIAVPQEFITGGSYGVTISSRGIPLSFIIIFYLTAVFSFIMAARFLKGYTRP